MFVVAIDKKVAEFVLTRLHTALTALCLNCEFLIFDEYQWYISTNIFLVHGVWNVQVNEAVCGENPKLFKFTFIF